MHAIDLLIGIDDTDNLDSRGTGFRVRELGRLLTENRIARVFGITRHQLFVSPLIPYTSHNSSACMAVAVESCGLDDLTEFCRDYLLRECAEGSDAGLCIAPAGVLAVVLHELFRWPLRMPGRHGLEWMAILIFARTCSTYRWAGAVTAFGAASASLLPLAGAIEPLAAASYWITGVIVDLLYRADKQWRRYAFYLALIAAAAHSVRPLLNWIELLYLDIEHHSLTSGL